MGVVNSITVNTLIPVDELRVVSYEEILSKIDKVWKASSIQYTVNISEGLPTGLTRKVGDKCYEYTIEKYESPSELLEDYNNDQIMLEVNPELRKFNCYVKAWDLYKLAVWKGSPSGSYLAGDLLITDKAGKSIYIEGKQVDLPKLLEDMRNHKMVPNRFKYAI